MQNNVWPHAKSRVIFVCPICKMTVKPEQEKRQVEINGGRDDTIYYAHESHFAEERED